MLQRTIKNIIECSGVGLHGGKLVSLVLRPAPENTGIRFDMRSGSKVVSIKPSADIVIATGLATTLGVEVPEQNKTVSISTVEHLLAAVSGLGIDNLIVETSATEVPIMDGSAATFVMLLRDAGIVEQEAPRHVKRIVKAINFEHDGKSIKAEPFAGLKVNYTIDFSHPAIGKQQMTLVVTPETFAEVSRARTFGFLKEVEYMRAHGLALGGTLDNAIVLDDYSVMNTEGLRFANEFVRHKILDFIGDMAMLGTPLEGSFTVHCSGHALNNQFLRVLEENADIYLNDFTYPAEVKAEARTKVPAKASGQAQFAPAKAYN